MSAQRQRAKCCCGGPGEPCPYCPDDPTPRALLAALANVVLCAGCFGDGPVWYEWSELPSILPNGPFRVVQAGPCLWVLEVPCTGTLSVYGDGGCGAPVAAVSVEAFVIVVQAFAGALTLDAYYRGAEGGYQSGGVLVDVTVALHAWERQQSEACFPQAVAGGFNGMHSCGWDGSPGAVEGASGGDADIEGL